MLRTLQRFCFALIFTGIGLLPLRGLGAQLPYNWHIEQNIDQHQIGYLKVSIDSSNRVTLVSKFSNGQKVSGNNFYSIVKFVSHGGKTLKVVILQKGLDASVFGHAREGTVTDTFLMNSRDVSDLDHIETKFGVRNCGLELTDLYFNSNGLNLGFGTKKCAQ